MTKAHRDRGVATEQLAARFLREHGFPGAERAVKTGLRTVDRAVADPGDLTGTPGLVWQIKALKPLTAAENLVPRWMVETEQQRAAAHADLGLLVVRRDQRPAEQWFAFLPLPDLHGLCGVTEDGRVRLDNPGPWGDDRDAFVRWPARLYLGDLVTLLRVCGYGDPLPAEPGPATGDGPVVMTAMP